MKIHIGRIKDAIGSHRPSAPVSRARREQQAQRDELTEKARQLSAYADQLSQTLRDQRASYNRVEAEITRLTQMGTVRISEIPTADELEAILQPPSWYVADGVIEANNVRASGRITILSPEREEMHARNLRAIEHEMNQPSIPEQARQRRIWRAEEL
jgi:chromosome segregation ATPase